jgi:hypothetical protein
LGRSRLIQETSPIILKFTIYRRYCSRRNA